MGPVLLVGANGSMGRRYQAILNHLGVPVVAVDRETTPNKLVPLSYNAQGIILATPTLDHYWMVSRFLADADRPILCEKPLSKDLVEVERLLALSRTDGTPMVRMMFQYRLLDHTGYGPTAYDFYHSGGDGLGWDCMQLLGLARGEVTLARKSPVWKAVLNGRTLSLDDVGEAYVTYVADWLTHPGERETDLIRRAHIQARWFNGS